MLPQIKKKIKAFLMDETGSISKANLIKGAIFLSSAGIMLKKVKAQTTSGSLTATGSLPGASTEEEGESCGTATGGSLHPRSSNSGECTLEPSSSTNTVTYRCTWVPETAYCTCTTGTGDSSGSCGRQNRATHVNSGTLMHWKADDQPHDNILTFTRGSDNLQGSHNHHGSHGNADSCKGDCEYTAHANHCSHSSHANGCSNVTW